MSEEDFTPEAKKLLQDICKQHGFVSYTSKITSGSCKGDGYASKLYRIAVNGTKDCGETLTLQLILKTAHAGEEFRKSFDCQDIFERELFVYTNVLPEFEKLQDELGIPLENQFRDYCKFYGGSAKHLEEVLIFENIKECGFEMWNRQDPMTFDVIKKVIETLGRYHALSFAMRDKKPEVFDRLAKELPDLLVPMFTKYNGTNVFSKNLEPAISAFDPIKDRVSMERFKILIENSWEVCKNIVKEACGGEYSVICHSDCWCNNMMFKFKKPGVPNEICLLDWQITRFASPVLDLCYFLLPNILETSSRMDELLEEYYISFSTFLRRLGCNPDKLFPYQVLKSHWKQFCVFGLLMASMLVKVLLVNAEDAPDLAKDAAEGKDFTDAFVNVKNEKEYCNVMKHIVDYCVDNNCL